MKKEDKIVLPREDEHHEVPLYDPYAQHFVSQNRRNEFLKSLEERTSDPDYFTIN